MRTVVWGNVCALPDWVRSLALDHLVRYPGGAMEQSMTAVYPWCFTDDNPFPRFRLFRWLP